mmetsp:Transcript_22896/g.68718  ORF Transcript_22896/g.68718 Transcript_22896/m.68718 type:complete len:245 (+) Transcript_22896:276-1010(+)
MRSSRSGFSPSRAASETDRSLPPPADFSSADKGASFVCSARIAASCSSLGGFQLDTSRSSSAARFSLTFERFFAAPAGSASRRSRICSSAAAFSKRVSWPASTMALHAASSVFSFSSRSSVEPISYSACSSSSNASRRMSFSSAAANCARTPRSASSNRFFDVQLAHFLDTVRENVGSSAATSRCSRDSAAGSVAVAASSSTAAAVFWEQRGKTWTKKRLRPVSCCVLNEPAAAKSHVADLSSA